MKPTIEIKTSFILKGLAILIAVLCCCILLDTCSNKRPDIKPQQVELKHAVAVVKAIEEKYQTAIEELKERNERIQKELTYTQEQLPISKLKQSQSKATVLRSARKDTVGKNPREQIADCDSLKQQVIAYVQIVDSTQCLYEKQINELNQTITNKDEEIALCNTAYEDLKNATQENLNREKQLTDDLKKAYKKQRRKNFSNKLLGVGVIVLTAVSGLLYVNAVH
jgi:chromosome segregation ATPase